MLLQCEAGVNFLILVMKWFGWADHVLMQSAGCRGYFGRLNFEIFLFHCAGVECGHQAVINSSECCFMWCVTWLHYPLKR